MSKTKKHEFDCEQSYRDISCPLCHNCHEIFNPVSKTWTGRCVYGGPFTGYLQDKDYCPGGVMVNTAS
jgi:hypothetical protein